MYYSLLQHPTSPSPPSLSSPIPPPLSWMQASGQVVQHAASDFDTAMTAATSLGWDDLKVLMRTERRRPRSPRSVLLLISHLDHPAPR